MHQRPQFRFWLAILLATFLGLWPWKAPAGEAHPAPPGKAKFELLGMLDEYIERRSDGKTIESFYAADLPILPHFEEVLKQFCQEEHLPPEYGPMEGGDLTSPAIADAIDQYYRNGVLDESVFKGASKEDLLRYVAGAYLRFGDKKKRSFFLMANSTAKMRTIGHVLARLGCTKIRLYDSGYHFVPTTFVLLFSPSPQVKEKLGIRSRAVLGKIAPGLDGKLNLTGTRNRKATGAPSIPRMTADPAVKPPVHWAEVTASGLTAIHDLLRDNSPAMAVERDSAPFRLWLEEGLQKSLQRVHEVHEANGYGYLLSYYANGFRDSSIWFEGSSAGNSFPGWGDLRAWPGFMLGLRGQDYTVVYTAPGARHVPPVGAILVSCDGHSPEEMVAERDGYDGDLSLESGRFHAAPDMLLDRSNPFVRRPVRCVFRSAGVDRSYTLHWRRMEFEDWVDGRRASLGLKSRNLGIRRWGKRSWWLSIPSLSGLDEWKSFFQSIEENLAAIRNADRLVIDLSGNAGDDSFGDKLVAMLWGQEFVDRYKPASGPALWRVTKLNRDSWAAKMKKISDGFRPSAEEMAGMNSILAEYDKAIAEGKPTFEIPGEVRPKLPSAAKANPMHGRVIILTDHDCDSAGLDFMDLLLALPGVVQAGMTTSADTIFMESSTAEPLPNGFGELAFSRKALPERPRGSNKPYTPEPSLTWHGDPGDEAGLKAWLDLTVPTAK